MKSNFALARKKKGLTQEQLGVRLNVAKNTISQWERGSREPDFKMLIALSKTLEVSIDFLLANEGHVNLPTICEVQTYSEKQKELLPLIQMLNDRQCQRTYDYLSGLLDITTDQQFKWGS